MILNFFAFILAILSTIFLLPAFNGLEERNLELRSLGNPGLVAMMILLYLLIGFASGVYPSVLLARLKLIKILKAGFSFSGRSGSARKSLIVFQFVVSIFLIISTVIIFQQLSFIQNKNLGYGKDHILVMPVDNVTRLNYKSVKDAISLLPTVSSVSCGAEEITNIHWDDELRTSVDGSRPSLFVNASPTDIDFVKTMGLKIRAGSDFTLSDWQQLALPGEDWHTTYMLNESAVKALGWTPESAIGKTIYRSGQKGFVKAVVKDFNYAPLHEPIGPLVIFLDSNYYHIYQMFVKISGKDIPSSLQSIASVWKDRVPHRPFQYHFLDENYNKIYHNERQTAKIFSSFSGLAILLACLGLFALAAYSTVQRAKEIGIRKVLGAGVPEILRLVSLDFIKLIGLASLIAFPLAWVSVNSWLRQFAFRIDISVWVFVLAAISATLIALLTISFQALRAALANPVKSLKSE